MDKQLRLLIVEDSEDDALLLVRELRKGGYDVAWERVDAAESMKVALEREWDLVVADYVLPAFSGIAALGLLQQKGLDLPLLIVSGHIGEDVAVGAMKAGAQDYIFKGNMKRLVPAVERELRDAEVRRKQKKAEQALEAEHRRFLDVLEMLPAYVVLLSPDYSVPFANRVFRERFGESEGRRCFEFLFNRTEPCEICETYTVLKTGASHHWEWTGPDNRDYDIFDYPFTDSDGSPLILEMGIDVTERKKAEEALRQVNETLEQRVAERTEALREAHDRAEWLARFPQENPNPVLRAEAGEKVLYCNPAAAELPAWACKVGDRVPDVFIPLIERAMTVGQETLDDVELGGRSYTVTIVPIPGKGYVNIYGRDVTARKQAESRIVNLTRLYAVLSRVNETIVRISNEELLYAEVCRIVAEEGDFPLVWIGQLRGEQVVPVASCGPAADYLKETKIEIRGKWGRGPTGTCIRENRSVVNDDFVTNPATSAWREPALRYGFHASAAFPLQRRGKAIGAFTLYAYEPNAFDAEQVTLLESLSADISYAHDVFDQEQLRVRTEKALLQAKEEWERTFDSVPEMIAILDNDHKVVRVNEAMAQRLGKRPDECVGLHCYEAVHGASAPPGFCPHSRTLADCRQHIEEVHEDRLGGDFVVSTTPLYDDHDKMTGSVHVARDITERKRVERELSEAHQRLQERAEELEWRVEERTVDLRQKEEVLRAAGAYTRSLLEASLDPLVTIDRDGRIADVNTATEIITGYAREDLIGTDFADCFTDSEKAMAGYQLAFEKGMIRDYELEIRHRDGHVTPVLYNASVYRDGTGEVAGVFASARDVTEQRRLEDQLRQAHKMEAIGTLAGGIAHDFNNSLAAIIGFTEMSVEDLADRPEVQKNLQRVLKSATRARDLVRQILTFSRKTEKERSPISLSAIAKDTTQFLRASIPSTIKVSLNTTATSDVIVASPVEIEQVLVNLCSNAAHAMQENGGVLDVSVTDIDFGADSSVPDIGPLTGEYVQLMVRDTGIGMTPDVMKRVFEPFFTTKGVGQGTGMGLAVTYGIVNDLQGAITVESTPGVGSVFRVFLPKTDAGQKTEAANGGKAAGGSERILFVDDEHLLMEWGQAALSRLGYKVTAVNDSTEALKMFSADPSLFDLVITDQTMPVMTGIQLARKVLAIRGNIPIILCTGHSETVSPETTKKLGIRQFLMKPVNKTELAEAVRRALDN